MFVAIAFFSLSVSSMPPNKKVDFLFAATVSEAVADKPDSFFISSEKNSWQPPELFLIQGAAVKGNSSPIVLTPKVLGSLIGDSEFGARQGIIEYVVQPGDTVNSLAERFDVSANTILWANNLKAGSKITPGQKLIVLPVSGVLYEVKKGDTLGAIALTHKGSAAEIIAFNELSGEGDIFVSDMLVIPDGVMPVQKYVSPSPSLAPIASSFFICPISSPCALSQRLHWYNAVDLTHGQCGDSIFAAAGGEVLRVKYGYNLGAGNYIQILHPNGVITTYGHALTSFVNVGDRVSQGQIIALMGGQPGTSGAGISTGCHLHFDVRGAKNPFAN